MGADVVRRILDYLPLITKVVSRRVPADQVEDLVQETIKRAVGGVASLKNHDALGGWLVRIASTVVSDFYRSRYILREVQAGTETQEVAGLGVAQDAFQEHHHGIMYRELVMLIVSRLEADDRRLIESVYIQELNHAEAAVQLGITETNLRVRMHRARAKLRELIAEYHDSVEFFGRRVCSD